MSKYIIAHDLGTSGNKATLFSTDGRLIASAVRAYDTHYFNGNWAEQNPGDWLSAVCETSADMAKLVPPEDIVAMSFSAHMMGCLPVDDNGAPLRPHILWCDQRATREAAGLEAVFGTQGFFRITGHRPSASYPLEKIMWVKEHEPDIYARAACFLQAKDYVTYRLTGRMMTDYSDASAWNAMDLREMRWSKRILDSAGVDAAKLPEPRPSTTVAGTLLPDMAKACGLTGATKVVIGAGDGAAATVGAGSVAEGITYACLGTSAWLGTTTRQPIINDRMIVANFAHAVPGLYAPLGTMQAAGASFSWLKNNICRAEAIRAEAEGTSVWDLINSEIAAAPIGSNGLLFLPYLLGERAPRWNPEAQGGFIGLKMMNTRADMLRSVIEGIGYNLGCVLNDFRSCGVDPGRIAVVGGLAKGAVQRRIFADIWGAEIDTLNFTEEAGSIGAAVIGGVGAGEFESFDAVRSFFRVTGTTRPDPEATRAYRPYAQVFDQVYDSLVGVFGALSKLV